MQIPGTHARTKKGRITLGCLLWILVGMLVLGHPALLKADTLTLKSGDVLEGQIVSETETQIEIRVSLYRGTIFSRRQVDKSDIQSIVHESLEQKQEKSA